VDSGVVVEPLCGGVVLSAGGVARVFVGLFRVFFVPAPSDALVSLALQPVSDPAPSDFLRQVAFDPSNSV
jgi:hypothetical protein